MNGWRHGYQLTVDVARLLAENPGPSTATCRIARPFGSDLRRTPVAEYDREAIARLLVKHARRIDWSCYCGWTKAPTWESARAHAAHVTDELLKLLPPLPEDSQPDPAADARAENAHALHRWKPSLGICDCGWELTKGKSHLSHVNEKITAARRSGSGTP